MAEYFKDSERIEAALPGRICQELASIIAKKNPASAEVMAPIVKGFEAAKLIPLEDIVDAGKRQQLLRRLDRAADIALNDLAGDNVGKALSAIHLWLNGLQENGILEIGDGSVFRATWDGLVKVLLMDSRNTDLLDAVNRSACKAAKRLRERLERGGYYRPDGGCRQTNASGRSAAVIVATST